MDTPRFSPTKPASYLGASYGRGNVSLWLGPYDAFLLCRAVECLLNPAYNLSKAQVPLGTRAESYNYDLES